MAGFTEEMRRRIREAFIHNVTLRSRYTTFGTQLSYVVGEPARETVDVVVTNLGERTGTDLRFESLMVFGGGLTGDDFTRAQPRSGRDEMSCKMHYFIDFRPVGAVKLEDLRTLEKLLEKCFQAACTDRVKTFSIPVVGRLNLDYTRLASWLLKAVLKQLVRAQADGRGCLREVRFVLKQNKEKLQQAFWKEFVEHRGLVDHPPATLSPVNKMAPVQVQQHEQSDSLPIQETQAVAMPSTHIVGVETASPAPSNVSTVHTGAMAPDPRDARPRKMVVLPISKTRSGSISEAGPALGWAEDLEVFPIDAQLDLLATKLGKEWQRLGIQLGLPLATVDKCFDQYDHPHMTVLRMLVKWRDQCGVGLSRQQILENLQGALKMVGNAHLAEYVRGWLPVAEITPEPEQEVSADL